MIGGIGIGMQVKLIDGKGLLGKVIAIHVAVDKATIRLPSGGTIQVPLRLLMPNESRPVARKSAPRPRTPRRVG